MFKKMLTVTAIALTLTGCATVKEEPKELETVYVVIEKVGGVPQTATPVKTYDEARALQKYYLSIDHEVMVVMGKN